MFDFRNREWRTSAVLTQAFLFLLLIFAAVVAPNTASAQVVWTAGPDAGFNFWRFDAEYSPATGKVYFLGGRETGGTNTNGRVWSFDPVTGAYADTGTDMPVPVSNYTIARVTDGSGNELLMIWGGRDQNGAVVNTVQGYNPVTNTTVDLTATDPYPETTSPGAVEVVGNKAYSFGGFDAAVTTAACHIFDITAADGARWTSCPDLNLSRSYIATGVVDGVIYAIGGDTFDGAALNPQTIVEKLDTANPTAWDDASVADLPLPCDENRGFGFDTGSGYDLAGKVIVAGCGQWPNVPSELAESLSYDVATNTWDQAFPDLINARRNHAGVFIPAVDAPLNAKGKIKRNVSVQPDGNVTGTPGMWVFGGRMTDDNTILATPEYYQMTQTAPTCNLFGDDFEDGVLDPNWSYEKPNWIETGGNLVGTPVKRSARAIASPAFAGCGANCTVEAHLSTAGGPFNKIWLYTFYVDKRNKVELLGKEENDRWILKQRINQTIVAKQKAISTIDPNVVYDAVVSFDGTTFTVSIDGAPLITMPAGGIVPTGTVGFQVKNTTGSFGDICVN
jgi:hypothetical protein